MNLELNFRDANLILLIELHERLIPFPVGFLNVLRVFEKLAVLAPGQIKLPIDNFEGFRFNAGSPAERKYAAGSETTVLRCIALRIRCKESAVFGACKMPDSAIPFK